MMPPSIAYFGFRMVYEFKYLYYPLPDRVTLELLIYGDRP
jgi:hypothetical protein